MIYVTLIHMSHNYNRNKVHDVLSIKQNKNNYISNVSVMASTQIFIHDNYYYVIDSQVYCLDIQT